ncbi:MAG: LamG domain-containing protein [Methylovulum sp.]|nr:LamG domain-containing protein [Methylovulum sp.]
MKKLAIPLLILIASINAQADNQADNTILYQSDTLASISNAISCNGNTYVSFTKDPRRPSGYPDNDSSFGNLFLLVNQTAVSVDSSGVVAPQASASIQCDSTNRVHLAYAKWAGFSYAFNSPYMIFSGSSLVSTASIFNNANWGYYTGLVLDNSDKARTIQFGHAGYFLNYSQNTTGAWVNSNISGYSTYYNYPVIALDSNNKSHLLTSQLWGSYGTLGLMQHWYQNTNNAWQVETVISDSRGHSNLVFSDSGIPNAAYVNASNEIKLVSKSGSTWQSETVDTFVGVRGDGISIALSPKGQVYIAAMDSKTLRLYTKVNGVWQYYLLNSNFVTPTIQSKPASILFDNGNPIVIYNDATTIFKATLKSTTPTITSIIPEENELTLGMPILFTVKGENLPNGMTLELKDCLYAREVGIKSPTERLFQCTPTGAEGQKDGKISYNSMELKNFSAYSSKDVSLISDWNFDNCTATDNSAQGVNGILLGSPKCVAVAKTGKSILLDKKSQSIKMTHIVPQAGLTFIAWVNPNTLHAGIADIFKAYPSDNVFAINNRLYFKGNKLCQQIKGVESCSTFPQRSATNWQAGYFAQVAYVVSKAKANLYVNGSLVSSTVISASASTFSDTLSIGGFIGRIDDVKLFKRALTGSEIQGIFDAQLNLDMDKPVCHYVRSIFMKNWQTMKVNNQPSCITVANYATWSKEVRLDVSNASDAWSGKLNGLDAANTFANKKIALIDAQVGFLSEVLDPDLRKAIGSKNVDIFKPKGIWKSLKSGELIFDTRTTTGKYLDGVVREKAFGIAVEANNASLCNAFTTFLGDNQATVDACNTELKKIFNCGYKLATEGTKAIADCVMGGLTSVASNAVNWFSVFQADTIEDRINDYILIAEYLNAIYERGETGADLSKTALFYGVAPSDATVTNIVTAIAKSYGYSNWDYDANFVESQIVEYKNNISALVNSNTKLVQDSKNILTTPLN